MLANPKHGFRRPLQPKNTLLPSPIHPIKPKPPSKCLNNAPYKEANKENLRVVTPVESIDVSLAEELSAVREKMERLRLDEEKTEKMLDERSKLFEFRLYEFIERGEFQRELEIEVDRLYRLKQLHVASMKMSPIRSLRAKEMEKKSYEGQFESINKSEESPSMSFESTGASTSSASISMPTLNSTASSKMLMVTPRLSLECASIK